MTARDLIGMLENVPPDTVLLSRRSEELYQLTYNSKTGVAVVEPYRAIGTEHLSVWSGGLRPGAKTNAERLRDIVRRFADLTSNLLGNYEARYRDDQNSMDFVANVRAFIEEARNELKIEEYTKK